MGRTIVPLRSLFTVCNHYRWQSGSLCYSITSSTNMEAKSILVSDVVPSRLDFLQSEYKVKVTADNRELVEKSDILILAVKPQVVKKVLENVRDLIDSKKLLVSIAAGVPIPAILAILKEGQDRKYNIVRSMPNTPALVQEGVTAIAPGENVSKVAPPSRRPLAPCCLSP